MTSAERAKADTATARESRRASTRHGTDGKSQDHPHTRTSTDQKRPTGSKDASPPSRTREKLAASRDDDRLKPGKTSPPPRAAAERRTKQDRSRSRSPPRTVSAGVRDTSRASYDRTTTGRTAVHGTAADRRTACHKTSTKQVRSRSRPQSRSPKAAVIRNGPPAAAGVGSAQKDAVDRHRFESSTAVLRTRT